MFKLSYQLLISRKKWLLLLVIVFSLIISSVTAIFTATYTIKSSLLSKSFQQFGEFSGVLYNISEKKEDIIEKAARVGHFILIDSLSIKNSKTANIGWVDQDFIDLGHITLINGNFPTNPNEVAIESYYLQAIDSKWKIGESRIIEIENVPQMFKLVGIINNYSARWSVMKTAFPNLFVSKSMFSINNMSNNYLIGFNQKLTIENNIKNIEKFISDYNGNGFINDRLFYNGLKDIKNIMIISYTIQFSILLVSSFSILSMLSYFNTNQINKFAIFKAIGCTDKKLFFIAFFQIIILYMLGIILSIPLFSIFYHMIINNTYGYSLLKSSMGGLLVSTLVWLVLLFILIVAISYLSIIKHSKNSININLKGDKSNSFLSNIKMPIINHFSIKQLIIQLLSYPKNTMLSIFTLTFSILVILFSFTMAKESTGIWDTKIDYYLTSQELIGTKIIDNKTVVVTKGGTFNPSEVREIEMLDGIKYIDKKPFMLDVLPLIEEEILTPSLISCIKKYNQDKISYNTLNEIIIPNVKYVLKNEEEISKLYPNICKGDLRNSTIIHIPDANNNDKEQLIGNNIILTKTYVEDDSYRTRSWDFEIIDVLDSPYTINIDGETLVNNEITIIIDETVAIEKEITKGYKDLAIYTDENLSKEMSNIIYNKVYSLTAGVPGSLFQYVPDIIYDNTRITDYLGFLGKLAFYISIVLAISSTSMIVLANINCKKYIGVSIEY